MSYYLNVTDPLTIPLIFIFLSCCQKVHYNKEISREIQNLVIHESQPVKSNPETRETATETVFRRELTFYKNRIIQTNQNNRKNICKNKEGRAKRKRERSRWPPEGDKSLRMM